jgi:protein-S-isoprenylcysteine O-methyltransferase Ste14
VPLTPGWWLLAPWVAFSLWWGVRLVANERVAERESVASRLVYMIPFVAAVWLLVSTRPLGPLDRQLWPRTPLVEWLGFAVEWLGVVFAIVARETLGKLWSGAVTLKSCHRIIRSGPYALVRHPIYTGILTGFAGAAVAHGQVRALVALLLAAFCFGRKIQLEERLLVRHFGEEYRDYRRQVRALIPFIL